MCRDLMVRNQLRGLFEVRTPEAEAVARAKALWQGGLCGTPETLTRARAGRGEWGWGYSRDCIASALWPGVPGTQRWLGL